MAYGILLKFVYEGFLGLLKYFLGDWRTFEGWCASQGCDPQKISSRRMISLMVFFIEKDLTEEGREQLRNSLNTVTTKRHLRAVKDVESTNVSVDPKNKWRAPKGWTPPNWNEEKSFQAAKSFMGFKQNPK